MSQPPPPTTPWWEQHVNSGGNGESFSSSSTMQCHVVKNEESGEMENRCTKVFRKWRHCAGKRDLVEEVVEETVRPLFAPDDSGAPGAHFPALQFPPPQFPPHLQHPHPGAHPSPLEGLFGNPIADALVKEIFGLDGVQREAEHAPGRPPTWSFRVWGRAPRWWEGGADAPDAAGAAQRLPEGSQQQPQEENQQPKSDWRKGRRFDSV